MFKTFTSKAAQFLKEAWADTSGYFRTRVVDMWKTLIQKGPDGFWVWEYYCLLAAVVLLCLASSSPLAPPFLLLACWFIVLVDYWSVRAASEGEGAAEGEGGDQGNPIQEAYRWFVSIPRVTGRGYALVKERAEERSISGFGVISGCLLSLFNAFVVYCPKVLQGLLGGYKGLIVISPLVAYGVAMGHDWAIAVLGHEFGHIAAYDERAYDWWYWCGWLPLIVGIFHTGAAWVLRASITLVNEAWASYNAVRAGFVRGPQGALALGLAYSTYVTWATDIFSTVFAGLEPCGCGRAH